MKKMLKGNSVRYFVLQHESFLLTRILLINCNIISVLIEFEQLAVHLFK